MIDWTALGEETIDLCRRYLMVDTTNPPGIAESAPGRANLVARLPGDGSLGAIVLHHHIDVVYADRRYWSVDPFGGLIRDGFLYGRGALDMKSTGVLQLAALLAIKRARTPLKRGLTFLGTADEEAGSRFGALWVADQRPDWLAGAEYGLGELAAIEHRPHGSAPIGAISISEKTGLPLRLIARAQPGHGSMPWPATAPHRLIHALERLLATERAPRTSSPASPTTGCCAGPGSTRTGSARSSSTRARRASTATTSGFPSRICGPASGATPRCCWPSPRRDAGPG
jgi:acetylornithine deacetylase/succinyl-diaminopimelate desuccinylase-like protein